MANEALMGQIKSIPIGTKITVTKKDIFGKPFNIQCRLMDEVRQNGYRNKYGSWGKYQLDGYEPCYAFMARQKGCSSTNIFLRVDDIQSVVTGW